VWKNEVVQVVYVQRLQEFNHRSSYSILGKGTTLSQDCKQERGCRITPPVPPVPRDKTKYLDSYCFLAVAVAVAVAVVVDLRKSNSPVAYEPYELSTTPISRIRPVISSNQLSLFIRVFCFMDLYILSSIIP
jgi:hypothetical protein